jgi:tripeptide aminopeptidase
MVNEERLVDLFKKLCLIDAPALKERASVDYVKGLLAEMGLEVREDEAGEKIGGNAGNLIATLKGTKPDAPKVFLSAHFDTVEPTAGLEIVEEDGVLRSGGNTILGADDKAGMAPAIEAVRVLKESGEPRGDVVLVLTVAEEIGLKGADALEVDDLDVDFGYVLDTGPPVGTFVTRTATHDRIEVTVRGVPAHAGKDPENGVNAIQVMSRAVAEMDIGRIGPETTCNLGVITGGTAVNVVCPFVTVKGEIRSTDPEQVDKVADDMIRRFESAAAEAGTTVEVERSRHYVGYQVDENSTMLRLADAASKKLGLEPTRRTTLGGSDANVLNAKGIPTLVLGTGMTKIHTHDEFVSREDLVKMAEFVLQILRDAGISARPTG